MKYINKLMKQHYFRILYEMLNKNGYEYSIENFASDFKRNSSMDKFLYLIYLISREKTVKNILLLCDFLMFTDTFFYDIHPVIYDYLCQALILFPNDKELAEWIVSVYEGHPDSPFGSDKIKEIKYSGKSLS